MSGAPGLPKYAANLWIRFGRNFGDTAATIALGSKSE